MSLLEYSETYVPKYHEVVELTKLHEELHWHEGEAKLQSDVEQWKNGKITDEEKNLVKNIFLLFTQSDKNVGQDYIDNLLPVFKNNEVRNMLVSFAGREGVHQRAYALLMDTLGFSDSAYHEFLNYAEMKEKHEFMLDMSNKSYSDIATSIAKQVLVEGVCLFASFAMLLNFQRFGKFQGMSEINQWSIRDESIHVQGLTMLFRQFLEEHPRIVTDDFKKMVYQAARDVVKLEDSFIDKAFEMGGIEGLTPEEVKGYIRLVCDYRMVQMGFKEQFDIKENPIPWMDWLVSTNDLSSFFETNVTSYSKNAMIGEYEKDTYAQWKTVYDQMPKDNAA